ncbi:hypothetical protein DPMN_039488 [Dreissena polymorpha]|uniref:Uncharacterized protein n=1 Tax=Dreissena polymorpha TaxID=45954 RepID=A0A9D4CUW7_DREPO|nr:hypothetical protein DPMN_039488 [Dreissena polymorpha]
MMAEGPMAILRLPKIRQAVVASPEPMLWFSKIRMELEILYLELWNRCTKCSSENRVVDEYNDILQEIERLMGELMLNNDDFIDDDVINVDDDANVIDEEEE